jgi:phosphoribosylanthranilate isomerase
MIPVKICGVTRVEDAILAAELGASAVGLIFWPNSPRRVDRAGARAIVRSLPPFVGAIGVFVNQVAEAADVAGEVGLTAVQFHGDEAADAYRDFPFRVIKSVPVRDATAGAAAADVPGEATVLLDAHDPVARGGTGRPIDWRIAAEVARTRPVILSGGLNAANLRAALDAVHPYAIDVSSGVESSPGRKDPAKLRELFAVLRTL